MLACYKTTNYIIINKNLLTFLFHGERLAFMLGLQHAPLRHTFILREQDLMETRVQVSPEPLNHHSLLHVRAHAHSECHCFGLFRC